MQNKHSILISFFLFLMLNFCFDGYSQKLITYKADNQPLNIVLSKVANMANVRFAFDDDFLSKIPVSISVSGVTAENFLKQLCAKYPVAYRLIGSTWVVYKDEKVATVKSKPKVEKRDKADDALQVTTKTEYIIKRLWYLNGTIIDARTGNRLKSAKLYVDEFTQPVTNELSFFTDETVGAAEVRAVVNHFGYLQLDTVFKAVDGEDITIKINPITIAGITDDVNYSEYPIHFQEYSTNFSINGSSGILYGGKEASDYANSFCFIPGIEFSERQNSGIAIRNGSSSANNILIDEIPVYNQTHLFGQISAINSDFIHQGFISRGGLETDRSTNSSGLIDLVGKNGFFNPTVKFTASLLDASLFVGAPLSDKISFSTAIRKSIVDYWPNYYYNNLTTKNTQFQSKENDQKMGSVLGAFNNYYDINAKITFQPNVRSELNLIFNYAYDDQRKNFDLTSNENYFLNTGSSWRSYSGGLTWKFVTQNSWNNSIIASISGMNQGEWNNSGVANSNLFDNYVSLNNIDTINIGQIQFKWKSEKKFKKATQRMFATSSGTPITTQDSISNSNNVSLAALFYQFKFSPLKWVELSTGVRGSFIFGINSFFPQPRLSIDFLSGKPLRFFYRFGQEISPLHKTQRFNNLFQTSPLWILPNESAPTLNSWQHIAGVLFEKNGLLFNLEAYRIADFGKSSYFRVAHVNNQVNWNNYILSEGTGIRQGIDLMLHYQHHIFHHSLAYSFSNVKEKYTLMNGGNYLDGKLFPQHQLNLSEMIRYSGWIAIARFNFTSGSTYLSPKSTINELAYSKLPAFANLDLSIVKQFGIGKMKIEAGAILLNILNSKTVRDIHYYNIGSASPNLLVSSTTQLSNFSPSIFITINLN